MSVTIVVPTFNEALNVAPLVDRINLTVREPDAVILFVDDSTDETPRNVEKAAASSQIPVQLLHRPDPVGGLGGAVIAGLRLVSTEWVVVMDGDLQHPPEKIDDLLARGRAFDADVVVASRRTEGGTDEGLDGGYRHVVSWASGALTRGMFPTRLRNVTDPMTGFFAVKPDAVDLHGLQPRGFKILLEILVRQPLRVTEVPFTFGERLAGESKASVAQGLRFLTQLALLRFGRLGPYAVIGALGTVLNLVIMAALLGLGAHYLESAIVAAALTILSNFVLQERFVFSDLRREGRGFRSRFLLAVGFNSAETAVRLPFLWAIVEFTPISPLISQTITLGAAFLVRFTFQARVVYRPLRTDASDSRVSYTDEAR